MSSGLSYIVSALKEQFNMSVEDTLVRCVLLTEMLEELVGYMHDLTHTIVL